MENISLINAYNDRGALEIINMMNNVSGINDVFKNREDRVLTSAYSMLIMKDEIIVGFINLVVEKEDYDFLFIDMGIKPEYRKQGIGKYVINEIRKEMNEVNEEAYIIGQTKKNNKGGNGCIKNQACYIGDYEDTNLFLLQEEKVKEFIDDGYYTKLMSHLEKDNKKKQLIK